MSHFFDRPFLRLALIGAFAASLGLAACGRKGSLDPPPAASAAGEQQAAPGGGQVQSGKPGAVQPSSKHFPLDPLLN